MTRFSDFLRESDLSTLKLIKELYLLFVNLEPDPISIEFQMTNLQERNPLIKNEDIRKFSKKIADIFPQISYDDELIMLRILPNDFLRIIKILNSNKSAIDNAINDKKIQIKDKKKRYNNETEKYALILKKMYDSAPKGYQMTFVHLFGIKYSKELKKIPLKQIALLATGRESLWVEIGKGMKLHGYVTITEEIKSEPTIIDQKYFKKLYDELNIFRKKEAEKVQKDIRSIFGDKTLHELIKNMPKNSNELIKIYGFGPYKTQKYGPELFNIIKKYENYIKPGTYTYDDNQKLKSNRIWTPEEDRQLEKEIEQGLTDREIADIHRRTIGSIIYRKQFIENMKK